MQHTGKAVLLAGALVALLGVRGHGSAPPGPGVVLGTFDSRGVAVAWIRSDGFARTMGEMRAELERARADGDADAVQRLEERGQEMQRAAHLQGFGNAPVDDILARIEERLPGIAAEAGVDVIVSKWAIAYRHPKAAFVDVTDLLVAEFDPDEATLRVIDELLAQDPVPADELDHRH